MKFFCTICVLAFIFVIKEFSLPVYAVENYISEHTTKGESTTTPFNVEEKESLDEVLPSKYESSTTGSISFDSILSSMLAKGNQELNVDEESSTLTPVPKSSTLLNYENASNVQNLNNYKSLLNHGGNFQDNLTLDLSRTDFESDGTLNVSVIQNVTTEMPQITTYRNKNLPRDQLLKKILIPSFDQGTTIPQNFHRFPQGHDNLWRPVIPSQSEGIDSQPQFSGVSSAPIKSQPILQPSRYSINESLRSRNIPQEPVTAYYFDLLSTIPTKQIGPLYDPSYVLQNRPFLSPQATRIPQITTSKRINSSFESGIPFIQEIRPSVTSSFHSVSTTRVTEPVLTTQKVFDLDNEVENSVDELLSTIDSDPSESVTYSTILNEPVNDYDNLTFYINNTIGKSTDFRVNVRQSDTTENDTKIATEYVPSTLTIDHSSFPTETSIDLSSTLQSSVVTPEPSAEKSLKLKPELDVLLDMSNESQNIGIKITASERPSTPSLSDLLQKANVTRPSPTTFKRPSPSRTFVSTKSSVITEDPNDFTVSTSFTQSSLPPIFEPSTPASTISSSTTNTQFSSTFRSFNVQTSTSSSTATPVTSTTSTKHESANILPTESIRGSSEIFSTDKTENTVTTRKTILTETDVPNIFPQEEKKTLIDKHTDHQVLVIVSNNSEDSVPELNLIKMNQNGTNVTHSSPFIKAAVSYDILEYCKHRKNIESILGQWVNNHLSNNSDDSSYGVEIFSKPDCENLYIDDETSRNLNNQTIVYFYVKRHGRISPNSTLMYPRDPTNLEISRELDYLKEKILHLELMNASNNSIILEEATVGTSFIIVAIVLSLLVLLVLVAVLVFFVIKRRKATDHLHGRRCTPAANDAYSLDSVAMFYHSFKRKSRKRASNKSLKSYLNQGFDDPNGPSNPLNFARLTHFISDNEGITDEFSNIPSISPKYDEMPRGVEDKNRYANVIPVPETRILLEGSKMSPIAEYINANSIHGPKGELRYYIATQAPLDNTVGDFWRMIWEQETKVIVMLTDFVEKGIEKCADYLPPSETLDCHRVYGEYQITLKSRDMREKYVVSMLQIKSLESNLVREIAHMWFTGWPQVGVPKEERIFISFILDVRMTRKQLRAKGPIVVHCSPGTGRTGTYITCDLCMRQFDDQKQVDVPKTVFSIRRERAGAVQTKEQYSFIYRVANLYAAKITTGNLDSF